MKLVDTNVLLYAADAGAEQYPPAKVWLEDALSRSETVIVPWLTAVGFLRVSTNPRFYPRPTSVPEALNFLRAVLTAPVVINGNPDPYHLTRAEQMLAATGRGGTWSMTLTWLLLRCNTTLQSSALTTTSAAFPASAGSAPGGLQRIDDTNV